MGLRNRKEKHSCHVFAFGVPLVKTIDRVETKGMDT